MITAKPAVCLRASTLLAAALLLLHLRSPLLADAFVYQVYAFRAHEIGLFQDLGTLRTYGYPLFLYALTPLTGLDHLHLSLAAGVAQYLLFAGGTMGLWSCVPAHNTRLRTAILLGLLLNPWLIAQVTDALTEGLVLGLLVSAAALTVRAFVRQTVLGYTISVAGAALLMALSVVVRPASVVLCVAWLAAVLLALPLLPTAPVKRVQRALASLLVTSVACLLVWGPQVLYNQRVSGELAFPLVCRLGDLQLAWGLHLWKYETLQLPLGGVAPWYYPNPWLTNAPALSPALSWYLQHPVAGAATVLAHLFNSFSVNYLFTYVEDLRAWHTWPLRALYWVLTILGAHQAWLWTVQWRHRARERIGARAGAPPALVVALLVGLGGGCDAGPEQFHCGGGALQPGTHRGGLRPGGPRRPGCTRRPRAADQCSALAGGAGSGGGIGALVVHGSTGLESAAFRRASVLDGKLRANDQPGSRCLANDGRRQSGPPHPHAPGSA
jgi:hypothetical protein